MGAVIGANRDLELRGRSEWCINVCGEESVHLCACMEEGVHLCAECERLVVGFVHTDVSWAIAQASLGDGLGVYV